jgi:hypothetical protein
VLFFNDVTSALFAPWNGYAPLLTYVTNPYNARTFSRRNDPVKQLNGSVSWIHGSHLVNMGGGFSQINEWMAAGSTQFIPVAQFGVTSNDPAAALFNATNFPNSSPNDQANAASLYALLTGRVSSLTRSVVLGESSKTYGANQSVDRVRQREFGLFIQDSWKIRPKFTFNYGLRLENQYPFLSLNGIYTRPGYAGLYGISGVGKLFQPGANAGAVPVLTPVTSDMTGYSPTHFASPTVGIAWVLPDIGGPLGRILGRNGQSVLRGGFAISTGREQLTNITSVWGSNQGRTINTSVDALSNNTSVFGPAGSVLFSNPNLPVVSVASTPSYPLPVLPGATLNDYDPNLKARYVESWNIGFQRALTHDTVLEVRYVGNRSARAWAALNLNEVNVVENGFLDQFEIAQSNLAIAQAANPRTTNFFNQGLPGQKDIPIISTALANTSNSTLSNWLLQSQAGAFANSIAGNVAQMGRLTAAGYPANLFQVNPATGGSSVNLTTNQGGSTYNSMQIELTRRMSAGLLADVSYSWSHALSQGNILSLRNMAGVTYPSGFDQRHGIKLNFVYELPFGPNKALLNGAYNPVLRKAVEGWQISGISRIQSGTPSELLSLRKPFNYCGTASTNCDGGVVLHNLTTAQLQGMMHITKLPNGIVEYLPQSLIDNSLAAFQLNSKTLDPTQPYIGPPTTPGQYGNQIFLYGPWLQKWDFSLVKHTRIGERNEIEFRAQALNAFNLTNFFLVPNGFGNISINTLFGQTRSAYNDINSTNDPGSRVVEFVLRWKF